MEAHPAVVAAHPAVVEVVVQALPPLLGEVEEEEEEQPHLVVEVQKQQAAVQH